MLFGADAATIIVLTAAEQRVADQFRLEFTTVRNMKLCAQRVCRRCMQIQSAACFSPVRSKTMPLVGLCLACVRERARGAYQRRKQQRTLF